MDNRHPPAAPDLQDGLRTNHPGALDRNDQIEAELRTVEYLRRIYEVEMPERSRKIRALMSKIATLDPRVATAKHRRALAEAQVDELERQVGAHNRHVRRPFDVVLLGVMAVGETMLAYPAFKVAVPSATGGVTDPVIQFLVTHGALFAAAATGAGSAFLQRAIGGELAQALRSVQGEHKETNAV